MRTQKRSASYDTLPGDRRRVLGSPGRFLAFHVQFLRRHHPRSAHSSLLSGRVIFATAAAVVLLLLLCPAVTRVVRVQPIGHTTGYTPSFQRSLSVPPDPHVLFPDVSIVPAILASVAPPRPVRWTRIEEDLSVPSFVGIRVRPLRAPPVCLA